MKWTPARLKLGLNLYPPYLFTGIRVDSISRDWRELNVSMKLRWYNRNAVSSHFGGSLYAMVDPHLMLMIMQLLGRDYFVWDQSATIHFKNPGRGRVRSVISISDETLARIRDETQDGAVCRPDFELSIVDDDDTLVASVSKVLYVRRKTRPATAGSTPADD